MLAEALEILPRRVRHALRRNAILRPSGQSRLHEDNPALYAFEMLHNSLLLLSRRQGC